MKLFGKKAKFDSKTSVFTRGTVQFDEFSDK